MNNRENLAWAAGFFDGEAYIGYIIRHRGRQLAVSIAQVERSPLDRFSKVVGKGKVYGPYSHRNKKHRDYYQSTCNGKDVITVVEKLCPFLCRPKKKQADIAIKGFNSFVPRTPGPKPLLSPDQVESVKILLGEGVQTNELAFIYGVSPTTIWGIKTGVRKYA